MHRIIQKIALYGDSLFRGVVLSSDNHRYRISHGIDIEGIARQYALEVSNNSKFGYTIDRGFSVLRRNLRRCPNVEILPYALGTEDKAVTMANDSARATGYFGTGQNFVNDGGTSAAAEFPARMRRGSELFAGLGRLDFIKCDIEGYEVVVMNELRPLLERFRPTVLIETGGENRPQIVALFTALGYAGFTLDRGREIPLAPDTTKDIIFRHAH